MRRTKAAIATAALLAASCSSSGHPAAEPTTAAAPTTAAGPAATPASTAPPPSQTLDAQTAAWSLPAPVSRPVVLPDGTGFLVLGGLATGDVSTSRIVLADPASGRSQLAGQLALAVHDSAGAALDGRWFVFGGGSYSTVSDIQAWTAGSATVLGRLPGARSDLSAVTAGATSYIVGGFDGTAMTPEVLATTDGVTFRDVAELPVPVRYAATAVLGDALWVVGGVTSTAEGGTAETGAVQRIDLATGAAAVAGHLSAPLGHAVSVELDGQVFVLGGRSGGAPSAAIWRLDPAAATLVPAGHLPHAVSDAGAVVVGNTGYLVGGEVAGPAAPLATVVTLRPAG